MGKAFTFRLYLGFVAVNKFGEMLEAAEPAGCVAIEINHHIVVVAGLVTTANVDRCAVVGSCTVGEKTTGNMLPEVLLKTFYELTITTVDEHAVLFFTGLIGQFANQLQGAGDGVFASAL